MWVAVASLKYTYQNSTCLTYNVFFFLLYRPYHLWNPPFCFNMGFCLCKFMKRPSNLFLAPLGSLWCLSYSKTPCLPLSIRLLELLSWLLAFNADSFFLRAISLDYLHSVFFFAPASFSSFLHFNRRIFPFG